MLAPELIPLDDREFNFPAGYYQPPRTRNTSYSGNTRECLKGPLRVVRLLLLITVVPALFICTPMYLRYRVFSGHIYPVGMSDMRLIDNKISTLWCQKQIIKSNATYNAFLVKEEPTISSDLTDVSMVRTLQLNDDMKEYWGFYLLKGSIVTVSTCVRWPGASLIMIRGHKHLQDCAYIGDDSSEELEELLEANALGRLDNATLVQRLKQLLGGVDSPANQPDTMKRHKSGVSFHDEAQTKTGANQMIIHKDEERISDVTEHDTKEILRRPSPAGECFENYHGFNNIIKVDCTHVVPIGFPACMKQELSRILEKLHSERRRVKPDARPFIRPDHLMAISSKHRHRDTNIDKDTRQFLHFEDIEGSPVNASFIKQNLTKVNQSDDSSTTNNQSTHVNESKHVKQDLEVLPTSREVFDEVFKKLDSLGERGKKILEKLNDKMASSEEIIPTSVNILQTKDNLLAEEKLVQLKELILKVLAEQRNNETLQEYRHNATIASRLKRQVMLERSMTRDFNADDEKGNNAMEEDLNPDGIADEHKVINETTADDMSNSEFWSSFSSSEEALLECKGLLLNLPLTGHSLCKPNTSEGHYNIAAHANAVTYRVPSNGYYFFVFNSENEVQTNFIRVKFELQKTTYELSHRTIMECRNFTHKCVLPLDLFSNEKVVLELPIQENDTLWNEEFMVISECEPRTSMYILCAILVPLLILLFAFQ